MRRKLLLICILAFLIQGCFMPAPGATPNSPLIIATPVPPSPTIYITYTPYPSATPMPTNTPQLTPTLTRTPTTSPTSPTSSLSACMQAGGRVEIFEFSTELLPDPLVYHVYLPPCYDEQPEQTYPVLYLVHGMYDTDSQWERLGVPETANRLIQAGQIAPFIVVMPRDRVWLEPNADNFGKAVQQSLVPWIDEHYRTIPDREHRAIGGLSRGGAWAVDIGLSRPDLFSRIGVHSGFVFATDIPLIHLWVNDVSAEMIPAIYIDVGDRDRPEISQGSTWLEDFLTNHDVAHEWHLFSGEHDDTYWKSHVEDYLRWYTLEWNK